MRKFSSLACGLVLAAGGLAQAQVTTTETVTTTTSAPETLRVSQILGSSVQLRGGRYGTVEDMILNPAGGVDYLVVANGGHLVMMPWASAQVNATQRIVAYDVTPQAVQPLLIERSAFPRVIVPEYVGRVGRIFPNRVIRREVIAPVVPGGPVIEEDVRVKPNGKVIIKERIPN